MVISENEHLVVAWAEECHGPGWSNTPVWYIVRDENGKLEQRCLQPDEQTKEMRMIFMTNACSTQLMTMLVENKIKKKG